MSQCRPGWVAISLACTLFLAGGLSAQAREGDIFWRPQSERPGIQATYVQGPWAVQWQGKVYLGGHGGYFGPPWERDGGERPFVIEYGPDRVTAVDNVLALPVGTHEFGFGSMARINGWWVYSAIYTKWNTFGQEDRTRLMLAMTEYPTKGPYPHVWWDLPVRPGVIMSALVVVEDRLVLFYGSEIYHVAIHEAGEYKTPDLMLLAGGLGNLPWSDVALGNDNKLYTLVSGNGSCYWWECFEVTEYVSEDAGLTWNMGDRHWSIGGLPGGVLPYVGDAAYVRDELGRINRDALTVIALVTPSSNPASGSWYLHWWSDPGAELPATFGMPPGTRKVRQHVYHQFIPRKALRP